MSHVTRRISPARPPRTPTPAKAARGGSKKSVFKSASPAPVHKSRAHAGRSRGSCRSPPTTRFHGCTIEAVVGGERAVALAEEACTLIQQALRRRWPF